MASPDLPAAHTLLIAVTGAPGAGKTRLLAELARWPFWLPLVLVGAVLLAAGRLVEAVAWLVLRFTAVSLVLLALVSLVRPARWGERLRRVGWWGPAVALAGAIDRAGRRDVRSTGEES